MAKKFLTLNSISCQHRILRQKLSQYSMTLQRLIRHRALLGSVIGSYVGNNPNNRWLCKDIPIVESYYTSENISILVFNIRSFVSNCPINRRRCEDISNLQPYFVNYLNIRWRCNEVSDVIFYLFSTSGLASETIPIFNGITIIFPTLDLIKYHHRILLWKLTQYSKALRQCFRRRILSVFDLRLYLQNYLNTRKRF